MVVGKERKIELEIVCCEQGKTTGKILKSLCSVVRAVPLLEHLTLEPWSWANTILC